MAFEGREVEFPMRFKLVPATDSDGSTIADTYDLERVEGTVTTEGTRSKVTTWKRGFYFIALKAGIPIQLYDLDYKNKVIRCNKELMPTGDVDADMREIMEYYKNSNAKYPEKFAIEEI